MPTLLTRLARAAGYVPAVKAAPLSGPSVALYGDARAVWTARDGTALAREGYQRNAVVHRAVRLVAEGAATIPLVVTGAEAADHPIAALLARPNPREGGTRLLETLYGHLMVSGNAALWSKCTKTMADAIACGYIKRGLQCMEHDCHGGDTLGCRDSFLGCSNRFASSSSSIMIRGKAWLRLRSIR